MIYKIVRWEDVIPLDYVQKFRGDGPIQWKRLNQIEAEGEIYTVGQWTVYNSEPMNVVDIWPPARLHVFREVTAQFGPLEENPDWADDTLVCVICIEPKHIRVIEDPMSEWQAHLLALVLFGDTETED